MNKNQFFLIKLTSVFLLLLLLLYFYTYNVIFYQLVFWADSETFFLFNGSLVHNKYWAFLWGYLNHYNETYLNLIPVFTLIILLLYRSGCSFKVGCYRFFYYVISLQLIIYLHKHIYTFGRISPSYFYPHHYVSIVELLGNENLKWNSHHSFPSGHSLALFYFFFFIQSNKDKVMTRWSFCIAIFFSMPRLFGGAHWLSDIVYAIILAYFSYLIFYNSGLERKLNWLDRK